MMSSIWILWLFHSSLVGLFVLGLLHFGRSKSPASQRHFFILLAIVFMAVLPLLPSPKQELGPTRTDLEAKHYVPLQQELVRMVQQKATKPNLEIAPMIWTVGFVFLLVWELKGLVSSFQFFRRARKLKQGEIQQVSSVVQAPAGVVRKRVRIMRDLNSPFTFGLGFVVLPQSLLKEPHDLKLAWTHEMAHIRRGDFCIELLMRLVRALLWFQPLAWVLFSMAQEERELACDDAVIHQGHNPQDYAQLLVKSCRDANKVGLIALGQHPLKRRVFSIINPQTKRGKLRLTTICLSLAMFSFFGFTSSKLRQPQYKISPSNSVHIEQFLVDQVIHQVQANPEKAADGAFVLLRVKEFFVTGKVQHIAAKTGSYSVKELNELYVTKIGPKIDQFVPKFLAMAAGFDSEAKLDFLQLLDHSRDVPGRDWKVVDYFSPSPSLGFETPELGRLAALAFILSGEDLRSEPVTEHMSKKGKSNLKWMKEHFIW